MSQLPRVLRLPDVRSVVGLSTSSIYAAMAKGVFPKPLKLGPRSVGWREDDVVAWLETREKS